MNRRNFLKSLAIAGTAAVVAPKVSYFFAPAGGWLLNGDLWAKENALTEALRMHQAHYERLLTEANFVWYCHPLMFKELQDSASMGGPTPELLFEGDPGSRAGSFIRKDVYAPDDRVLRRYPGFWGWGYVADPEKENNLTYAGISRT